MYPEFVSILSIFPPHRLTMSILPSLYMGQTHLLLICTFTELTSSLLLSSAQSVSTSCTSNTGSSTQCMLDGWKCLCTQTAWGFARSLQSNISREKQLLLRAPGSHHVSCEDLYLKVVLVWPFLLNVH